MTRSFYALLAPLAALLLQPAAHAYDVDTHFYGTYAMARYAGIGHEAAAQIACNAQWADEAFMTSPFFPTALIGTKVRRLIHFAGTEKAGDFSDQKLLGFKAFTETYPNHPIANELITQGLHDGSLLEATAGFHTLEDSYAHAGTPAQIGHAPYGHWPDRPFASIPKYVRMVETLFKAMVAVRGLLPEQALDHTTSNYKLDAETLAREYWATPIVHETVSDDMLTDPEYVSFAVNYIVERSQAVGFILPGVDTQPYLASLKYDGKAGVREVLLGVVMRILADEKATHSQIIDRNKALGSMGFSQGDAYIESMGGPKDLARAVIEEMIQGEVPETLTDEHRFEAEVEGPIRQEEMSLRTRNMRRVIQSLFGINVRFAGKGEKADPETPDEVVVTKTHAEEVAYARMITHYIFPHASLSDSVIESLANGSDKNPVSSMSKAAAHLAPHLIEDAEVAWDIGHSHLVPQPDDLFYQYPDLYAQMTDPSSALSKQYGAFHPFSDVDGLEQRALP